MADRTTYTLDRQLAADLPGVVRAVKATRAGSTATTPYANGRVDVTDLWLEIIDWDGAPDETVYTVTVWNDPYGGSKLTTTDHYAPAWNRWQRTDSSTRGACYVLVAEADAVCGDYIGIEPLPTEIRYKALAYTYRADKSQWGYVFSERNDPIVKMTD